MKPETVGCFPGQSFAQVLDLALRSRIVTFPARMPAVWLANAAGRIALASGVGYVAAAYTVSRFLTRPRRKRLRTTPADLGLPFEPIDLIADDQVKLNGWVVEPPEPRG